MRAALGSLPDIVPGGEESAKSVESVDVEEREEPRSAPVDEAEAPPAEEPQPQPQPGEESQPRPEFDRVTDVLGPLEQIVLAADQQIGSLQERVDAESDDVSARVDERVRDAAVEQRARVVKMREELTDAATQLATRFETMLDILDQAERQLSIQAGDVRVKVTERGRMTISHEQTIEAEPKTDSEKEPKSKPPPAIGASMPEAAEGEKQGKGIRRWFRRFRGSDA
jgi:hypothetical protein